MDNFFIAIQATYSNASISLFSKTKCLETLSINDARASSYLIPHLDALLKKHNVQLNELDFIAVDKGPGAFTSLRVALATVNGIAFAHNVALVGVDGLDALAQEAALSSQTKLYAIILNAYNNDVYYGLYKHEGESITCIDKGCKKIDALLPEIIQQTQGQSVTFAGNAGPLHQELIKQALGSQAFLHEPQIMTCSSHYVGLMAYEINKSKQTKEFKIEPMYLKTQYFAIRNS